MCDCGTLAKLFLELAHSFMIANIMKTQIFI